MKTPMPGGTLSMHSGAMKQPGLRLRLRSGAERLSAQHRQLNTFFEMVLAAIDRHSLSGARTSYVRFRDALEAHLSLEDEVLFPALRGLRPELDETLTSLVLEHKRFRTQLERLHELLALGSAESFGREFEDFTEEVAQHERREESLLATKPSD